MWRSLTDPAPANVVNSIIETRWTRAEAVCDLGVGKNFIPLHHGCGYRPPRVRQQDHPSMRITTLPPLNPTAFHPAQANLWSSGHDTDSGLISVYAPPSGTKVSTFFIRRDWLYNNLYAWEGDGTDNVPQRLCQPLYAEKQGADFSNPGVDGRLGAKSNTCWTVALAVYTQPD
jgi:hypothetical protein